MRIRSRRRDAAGNPLFPIPPLCSYYGGAPPPLPAAPTGGRRESCDGGHNLLHERIPPSWPRSSRPTASPPAFCRFCAEYENANRRDKEREGADRGHAQLSENQEGLHGRRDRSETDADGGFHSNAEAKEKPAELFSDARSSTDLLESQPDECLSNYKSETEAGGFLSDAEAMQKAAELLSDARSSTNLQESPPDECMEVEICPCSEDHESKAIPDRSKQGNSVTKSPRERGEGSGSTSTRIEMRHLVGQQRVTRTNNNHWTSDEVNQLVDGISAHGVGHWSMLKSTYFSTSIRTAQHLKDKWRNLLLASGLQMGCKKKVETIRIGNNLRARILALHEKHIAATKRMASGGNDGCSTLSLAPE